MSLAAGTTHSLNRIDMRWSDSLGARVGEGKWCLMTVMMMMKMLDLWGRE